MHAIANILTDVEWTTMGLAAVVTVGFWGGAAYLTSGRRRLANIEYEQERQRKQVNASTSEPRPRNRNPDRMEDTRRKIRSTNDERSTNDRRTKLTSAPGANPAPINEPRFMPAVFAQCSFCAPDSNAKTGGVNPPARQFAC